MLKRLLFKGFGDVPLVVVQFQKTGYITIFLKKNSCKQQNAEKSNKLQAESFFYR